MVEYRRPLDDVVEEGFELDEGEREQWQVNALRLKILVN